MRNIKTKKTSAKFVLLYSLYVTQYIQQKKSNIQNLLLLYFFLIIFLQSWLAFVQLSKPFFTEHNSVGFPNTKPPKDEKNNAYCQVSKE